MEITVEKGKGNLWIWRCFGDFEGWRRDLWSEGNSIIHPYPIQAKFQTQKYLWHLLLKAGRPMILSFVNWNALYGPKFVRARPRPSSIRQIWTFIWIQRAGWLDPKLLPCLLFEVFLMRIVSAEHFWALDHEVWAFWMLFLATRILKINVSKKLNLFVFWIEFLELLQINGPLTDYI